MNKNENKNTEEFKRRSQILCILITSATLIFFFFVGCLMFLRPKVSENEKRTLTEFPKFTISGFLSGEWTSQVSLWYSDTYPLREGMIAANNSISSLYGVTPDEAIKSDGKSDTLDKGDKIDKNDASNEIIIDDGNGNDPNAGNSGETIEGFYVLKDTAYELYYFNKQNSLAYVNIVNKAASRLEGKVNIYDMIVPLAYEFALGDNVIEKYGAADCSDCISYMYSGFENSNVKTIDICKNLRKHKDEYLYFRTDHHWTALGAYYAYESFCQAKGIDPTPLSSYEKLEFGGFLGTLYDDTQASSLYNNPDTVYAYVPSGTNSAQVTERNGKTTTYSIVNRSTDTWYQKANSKYNCFIAGDNPLTEIHNSNISDGSCIVVVKESFGNAFVPFLVDSYEYIYVVDYRYFKEDLCEFVISKGADDLLFINNVVATSASPRLNELKNIIDK